jgi:hypothetical protein
MSTKIEDYMSRHFVEDVINGIIELWKSFYKY